VIGDISRDVDVRSIHQFMVVGQRVGKPLEFLNRDAGGDRHDDYYTVRHFSSYAPMLGLGQKRAAVAQNQVGQTIAFRGLSGSSGSTMAFNRGLGDRRPKAIVCPTSDLGALI